MTCSIDGVKALNSGDGQRVVVVVSVVGIG